MQRGSEICGGAEVRALRFAALESMERFGAEMAEARMSKQDISMGSMV